MANPYNTMIDQIISQLEEPDNLAVTPEAQSDFNKGMDKANEYRGHPSALWEALKLFGKVDSRPLYYAGIAYIHMSAAYEQEVTFNQEGLDVSQQWVDKARELTPETPEILVVQAYIHIHRRDFGRASETLSRLAEIAPHNFYALCAQLEYYVLRQNKQKLMALYKDALALALTTTRKAHIQSRMAKYFLLFRMIDESIEAYQELAKITPADPWMWHNMSLLYLQKKSLIKALQCNNSALKLMDFGNARYAQEQINQAIIRRSFRVGVVAVVIIIFLGRLLT